MIGRESFDQRSPKQVFEDDVRSLMTEVTDPDTNKKSYMLAPGKTMYDAAAVLGAVAYVSKGPKWSGFGEEAQGKLDEFMKGEAGSEWQKEVLTVLHNLTDVMAHEENKEFFYGAYNNIRQNYLLMMKDDYERTPFDERTFSLRDSLKEARTWADIERIAGVMDGLADTYREKGGYAVTAMNDWSRSVRSQMPEFEPSPFSYDNFVPTEQLDKIRADMNKTCIMIGRDKTIDRSFDFYRARIQNQVNSSEKMRRMDANSDVAKEMVDTMRNNSEDIRDIFEKMKAEGSRAVFGDSEQYQRMFKAAQTVSEMAEDMDRRRAWTDPRRLKEYQDAMNELGAAAEVYADKEAYKEKKTSKGVSRKNSALAFIQLTNVVGAGEAHTIKDNVTDMRISRSESKDGARRERKSIDDLIKAETGEASRKYHEKRKKREFDKTADMVKRGVL